VERPVPGEHKQAPAVRAERQFPDALSLPGKKADLPAGCRVPDANCAVGLSGGELIAVRAEGDRLAVAVQPADAG
jgi:hypothetical protein